MSSIRLSVLLIDDDPAEAELVQGLVRERQPELELHHLSDGAEALRYLGGGGEYGGTAPPDLILLDLRMPMMDGVTFLRIVKGRADLRHIPVLVFTVSAEDRDRYEAYQARANGYLLKPASAEEYAKLFASLTHFWGHIARLPTGLNPDRRPASDTLG